MEQNKSFSKKNALVIKDIGTIKMSNLNLFNYSTKIKKPSKNKFFDEKFMSKNNENTSIILDPSANFFYKVPQDKSEISQNKTREQSRDNFLFKKNFNSTTNKNKKFLYDSFSQLDNLKKDVSKISNLSNKSSKKEKYFPKLSIKLKKNTFRNLYKDQIIYNDFEYKKKIKKINSSFSPDSFYSFDKKLFRDFSNKNILYNSSGFSNKILNLSKIHIKKSKDMKLKLNKSYIKENIKFNGKIFPNRKMYNFVVDPLLYGKIENIKVLSKKFRKMDKKVLKLLEMDKNKLFSSNYSIIERKKFSPKFQNIFMYDEINFKKKENEERYKELINLGLFKNSLKLLEDVKQEAFKIDKKYYFLAGLKKIKINKTNKQSILQKFKSWIIYIFQYIKMRYLTLDEIKNFKLIKQSFTYGLTESLINSIKLKNYNLSCSILEQHKYLVLDFDYYYLTPLHWAVKKNFYEIIPKLLDYGAAIDPLNFIRDSPLHIAVKNNFFDSACILLYYLASPFLKDKDGKKPIELTNDFDMKSLLERVMNIHYLSFFQKNINQQKFIRHNFWILISEEFKNKINKYAYDIIKNKELFDF